MGDGHQIKQEELIPRFGTFLMLMGLFAFILFLASDFADQPDFDWLFICLVLMAIGFVFRRRAAPAPKSGRFSGVKKWRESAKARKEKRSGKKKDKH